MCARWVLDLVYSWIGKKNLKYYLKRKEKLFSVRIGNIIVVLLVIHDTDLSPFLKFYMSLGLRIPSLVSWPTTPSVTCPGRAFSPFFLLYLSFSTLAIFSEAEKRF